MATAGPASPASLGPPRTIFCGGLSPAIGSPVETWPPYSFDHTIGRTSPSLAANRTIVPAFSRGSIAEYLLPGFLVSQSLFVDCCAWEFALPTGAKFIAEYRVMQKLVDGIHHFQNDIFTEKQRLFHKLVAGQHPLALFITCADSRIDPSLLTQTEPGELFILRNAGNIVPPYGAIGGGEAATIEYAVNVLKVKDIIICGHSHCGAMNGLLHPAQVEQLPAVKSWLCHAESTRRIIAENYAHITDPAARLTATVEENVLVQLEHLRTQPTVAAALGRKALNLHGWVYKFETGQVFAYHPDDGQFSPLDQMGRPVSPPTSPDTSQPLTPWSI